MWTASEEQVLELMKGVDISEACDHDGVGNKIIKLCSEGFHVYFTPCVNLYHSVGHYPNEWKLAIHLLKNDNRQLKVKPSCFSAGKFFQPFCQQQLPIGNWFSCSQDLRRKP